MSLDLFLIAICNGCFWSGIMDAALPRYFDQLPKPLGCSKCMAFWSMLTNLIVNFVWYGLNFDADMLTLPFVSALVAAIGYRTFRLR